MTRTGRLIGAGLLAIALVAAGCSDDDATGDGAGESTTTAAQAAEGPDETATGGADAPAQPSAGCEAPPAEATSKERVDVVSGGAERYFLITAPAQQADEPLPLVVDIHGLLEGADVHALHSGLGEYGQEHGFITVFPHGSGEPVAWDTRAGAEDNGDLSYLDDVLERVTAHHCVDEARVYATGLSNGAMMTSLLACERSDRFAAVAPVDGILAPEPCEQERTVPILATHGTADPILLFNGGVGDLTTFLGNEEGELGTATSTTAAPPDLDGEGYPANVAEWASRNGCDPTPRDEQVTESVLHRTYDCPTGADVEFYVVEGGGHSWPGSDFSKNIESIVGPTTDDIDWNDLAWAFFQRFSLG